MPDARALAASLRALDARQAEAVGAPPGPLLVLAGAGSGKTRVLTERAASLASGELTPEAVLVITFTNRAADELRERLCALVGERPALRMTIGTFHAVCHRMVRRHARRAGRTPVFSVYDQSASRRLVRRALTDVGLAELTPALAALQIGQAKARLLSPTDYRALRDSDQVRAIAAAWERYERYLAQSDALDFDDLIGRAVVLLGAPDLAAVYRQRWRAVLIDEYQDTNPAQYQWVKRLVQDHRNLSVVADDDQAIYRFRGAEVQKVLDFERDFPEPRVILLERNYRSSGAIVEAAAALIGHNQRRREKRMWTSAEPGRAVTVAAFADEAEEAPAAAAWCEELCTAGTPVSEIAVLFRTRLQARPLEDALLLAGMPYRVLTGQGLLESAAVRDLVAHLTLLVNPRDRLALARALAGQEGVGGASVARVLGAAQRHGGDLVATCVAGRQIEGVRQRQALAVERFGHTLEALRREAERRGVGDTVVEAVLACGLAERLRREADEDGGEGLERLRRLCRAARHYERRAGQPTLAEFLGQATLAADPDDEAGNARVTLATLHAAKGSEWDHVRIVGLCEGVLPHEQALRAGELEEERRLAYVGMTRARQELALSWPRRRHGRPTGPSRFLSEAGLALPALRAPRGQAGGRKAA
jgi:DNA helicase II / ATP-dependent DNA helicase PcrA